jgi:hypothetical protein
MQLFRSGKVVLILTDGRRFEVNQAYYRDNLDFIFILPFELFPYNLSVRRITVIRHLTPYYPHVQVNSGMYASFAQYIGAIVLDEEAIARALADSIATAATAAQTKKPAKKSSSSSFAFGSGSMGGGLNKNDMSGSEPILGKLLVMGNVTKKLVIMPDYPIGERHCIACGSNNFCSFLLIFIYLILSFFVCSFCF